MRKTFIRLVRLFTAMAAVVGIVLHPASKLVDGVSGATRQRNKINNDISTSDNSTRTNDNSSDSTATNDDNTSTNTNNDSNSNTINYNSDTNIARGWVRQGTNWAYIKENGSEATGWLNDGGKWYYFSSNGVMLTGMDSNWWTLVLFS